MTVTTRLSLNEIRARLTQFAERWKDARNEDAEAKSFWDDLFECFGTPRRQVARFEPTIVKLDGNKGFIDLLWKGRLIVEHKSRGKDLAVAKEQAEDYVERLKPAERPQFLVVCDFARFEVYDLHDGHEHKFTLADIAKNAEALGFIGGYEPKRPSAETPVNIEAVERLGKLYDEMRTGGYPDHDLQLFLVRILFCLFAEDTGVFEADAFTDFIVQRTSEDGSDLGPRLNEAFHVLNNTQRQKALDEALVGLPYVNGQLFAGALAPAAMNSRMRAALVKCAEFDWSKISPAIFGSLFQGVMESAERRAIGAHYTSEEAILRVLRPLFLNDLRAEFAAIKNGPSRGRAQKLQAFHQKLAGLKFMDPACGCGNFLIVTYREIRRLEIELLLEINPVGQQAIEVSMLSRIDVDCFFGIEIDEFPVQIARVALWLMDHVMNVELGNAFGHSYARLPLRKSATIVLANAMRIDWSSVLPSTHCTYLFGNPPFHGSKFMTVSQKEDSALVFPGHKQGGVIDYVGCWYKKAVDYCEQNPAIRCAFVSTNSITQGEQVPALWPMLLARGLKIHFAHRTFQWKSEARGPAHVHVVIIGFGINDVAKKTIYYYQSITDNPVPRTVEHINPYLINAPDIIVYPRSAPLGSAPEMTNGSIPADGGNLIVTDKAAFLAEEPEAKDWLRPYLGARGLINNEVRHCLWLKECPSHVLRSMPSVRDRVEAVRTFRLASKKVGTQEKAATPTLFTEDRQPDEGFYVAVPRTSSTNRLYIPIVFLSANTIAANDIQMVPSASLYVFGIIQSKMHLAWVATISGRLKSDYRYSARLAYNAFPWPVEAVASRRKAVQLAAQAVLDARLAHSDDNLDDLYAINVMPADLVRAHHALDRAVERCYRREVFESDDARAEYLLDQYAHMAGSVAIDFDAED
jgi:hypothetical protein